MACVLCMWLLLLCCWHCWGCGCQVQGPVGEWGPSPTAPLSHSQTPMSVKGSRALMLFLAKT